MKKPKLRKVTYEEADEYCMTQFDMPLAEKMLQVEQEWLDKLEDTVTQEQEAAVPDGLCKKTAVFLEEELGTDKCRECSWLKHCEEQIGGVKTFE